LEDEDGNADFGEAKCLVLFLRPKLAMAEMTEWPRDRLSAFGETYSSCAGEWTGFYDWLRNADRRLLGIRYGPFETTAFVISQASQFSYVKAHEGNHLEIFFANERDVKPELSTDQEFLYDPAYLAPSGECALTFALDGLSKADHQFIARASVEWVPI
jgi:hypothetical protein